MTAAVLIALDTTPPTIEVRGPASVSAPDHIEVYVEGEEPLSGVSVTLTDSLGDVHTLGSYDLTGRLFYLTLSSVGLPTGGAVFQVRARDLACNLTEVRHGIIIERPRVFDVTSTFGGPIDTTSTVDRIMDVDLTTSSAWDVSTTVDRTWDAELTHHSEWDVETEVSRGEP